MENLTQKELQEIEGGLNPYWGALALGILGNAIYDAIKDPSGTLASIEAGFNSTNHQ